MTKARRLLFLFVTFGCLGACERSPEVTSSDAPDTPSTDFEVWPELRQPLVEAYLKAHPMFAVFAGRHEYDGLLPDWSAEGIASEIRRLHAFRDRALAVPDASLAEDARFERDNFVARIDRDLFWLETAEAPFTNPAFYLDWMLDNLDPSPYLTRDYAPLPARMRAYTKYAKAIPAAAGQIRANLRAPLALPLLERGVSAFAGFADFFEKDVAATFASVTDPALQSELADANRSAAAAMRELASRLESQRARATGDFALGAERFAKMLLATEGVTTSLADLEAAGRADLERNQAALKEACAQYVPGASIPELHRPCASQQTGRRRGCSGLAHSSRSSRLLCSRPVSPRSRAPRRRSWPRRLRTIARTSPTSTSRVRTKRACRRSTTSRRPIRPGRHEEQSDYIPGKADLLFTSVHEVWPGHFLQYLHANRNPSIVNRLFVGYAYAEGWAHYAEEMMWEMGLGDG